MSPGIFLHLFLCLKIILHWYTSFHKYFVLIFERPEEYQNAWRIQNFILSFKTAYQLSLLLQQVFADLFMQK